MFESLDILRMAQAHAAHAGLRQRAIAQNVANADTPGYRARDAVDFATFLRRGGNGGAQGAALIGLDPQPATRAPNGNTVSLEHEMVRAAEARNQHELALGIYAMTRDLIRAGIGR